MVPSRKGMHYAGMVSAAAILFGCRTTTDIDPLPAVQASVSANDVRVGQPIVVTAIVTNETTEPLEVLARPALLDIRTPDGRLVASGRFGRETADAPPPQRLTPGESATEQLVWRGERAVRGSGRPGHVSGALAGFRPGEWGALRRKRSGYRIAPSLTERQTQHRGCFSLRVKGRCLPARRDVCCSMLTTGLTRGSVASTCEAPLVTSSPQYVVLCANRVDGAAAGQGDSGGPVYYPATSPDPTYAMGTLFAFRRHDDRAQSNGSDPALHGGMPVLLLSVGEYRVSHESILHSTTVRFI